jgi:hypothetical protein
MCHSYSILMDFVDECDREVLAMKWPLLSVVLSVVFCVLLIVVLIVVLSAVLSVVLNVVLKLVKINGVPAYFCKSAGL